MEIKVRNLLTLLRSFRASEAGGALVETAITLPLLTTLVLGAVELARVAYSSIEVTNAARAGVAYGSESGGTASDTGGITFAAVNDAANVPNLSVTNISVAYICSDGTTATGANTDCPNTHIEETLTVNTQATLDPLIHLPGLPTSYTLHGQAVQKCLQ